MTMGAASIHNIFLKYERIKALREDRDLKHHEVAEYLRIARSTYSGCDNAWSDIPTEILIALAQYYGVPADYLLGMTDETKLTRPQKSGEEHGAAQTVPYAFDDILPQFLI